MEESDKYIVAQLHSYNNDPTAKNYSNCDISGSFYTVEVKKATLEEKKEPNKLCCSIS